ncbi:hypothetical protein HDU97_005605 [Phlyctochytrium planicorne]|nr:hypothetical protein HDU97_005605 [Phlyctochytrium planicorne]
MLTRKRVLALCLLLAIVLSIFVMKASANDDVEDYEDDEEEEVEFAKPSKAEWTPPLAKTSSAGGLNWSNLNPMDFVYEGLALVGIAIYLGFHFYGRSINLNIARDWFQSTMPVWDANFSHIGDDKDFKLIRDGPQDFIFYASGRRHVQRVYGFIKLLPRFDILGFVKAYVNPASAAKSDKVVINFTLDSSLEGIVFAILPKATSAKIIKSRQDLSDFAVAKSHPRFPKEHYVMLTDAPEFVAAIMDDDRIVNTLWASLGLNEKGEGKLLKTPVIESIILTDQEKELPASLEDFQKSPKTLTATFLISKAPTAFDNQLMIDLISTLIDLIEYNAQIHFTAEGKSKLKKIRQGAEERIMKKLEEARKAELAKAKQEALRKKEQEVGKMSAEEQRKWEEKKHKQELKKRMKKGKVTL